MLWADTQVCPYPEPRSLLWTPAFAGVTIFENLINNEDNNIGYNKL